MDAAGCGDDSSGSGGSGASSAGGQASGGGAAGGDAGGGGAGGAGGAGGSGGSGPRCTEADDECDPGLYCSRPGCGTDGTCEAIPPPNVDLVMAPVCGCDGITYWNAAIAGLARVSTQADGVCGAGDAVSCDALTTCGGAQKCNTQVFDCSADQLGTCWGMPISCAPGGLQARACSNGACAEVCALISSQNPWNDAGDCP